MRTCALGLLLLAFASPERAGAQEAAGRERYPSTRGSPWSFDPDTGAIYQRGEFKITTWGYAERVWAADGAGTWPRVRQGAEVDFPRLTATARPVAVYEVDVTNTDFFRRGAASRVFEKLYMGLEPTRDDGRFRALVGQNTYILARESNLSTGNLPTIRRSLILEEHGRVGSFSPQLGVQLRVRLSNRYEFAGSVGDNRGGFASGAARYAPTNAIAGKLTATLANDRAQGRKLTIGAGADYVRAVRADTFLLRPAIGSMTLGGAAVSGRKQTIEGDVAYVGRLGARPYTVEAEALASRYPASRVSASGGHAQLQVSLSSLAPWSATRSSVTHRSIRWPACSPSARPPCSIS
ncbi:MAG: hypothetical protein WKG32_07520 [Gemmatimonadaceae bacterium]